MTNPGDLIGRGWRALRRMGWVVIGIIIFLAIVRLILPYGVKRYVNHQLNLANDYGGGIESVHLQLWRGQYRINDIKIFKKNGKVQPPLFAADQLYLAIEWKELFHGSVVVQVKMNRPCVNLVSGPTEAQSQSGTNENWNAMLSSLFPFDLNRLEITNGQIHFKNDFSTPKVDIYVKELSVVATNLNNSRKVGTNLPGGVIAHATTLGGGGFYMQLQIDPMAKEPTYQVTAQLTNVDLTALNDFLKAYGKFDVERGQFGLYTSVASKDGNYDGYVKVFFDKLKVFAWEKEKKKDAAQIFWEAIVGTLTTALKNQPKDSLAMRVPISGSYNGTKVGTWTAISTLLRNAFVRALVPKIDEKETVQGVEKKLEQKKKLIHSPPPEKGAQKLAGPGG